LENSAETIYNLLDKVGIVSFEFRFFECDIRGFPEFLVGLTKMVFEIDPSLLDSW
jgi:hypothetical protein